MKNFLLLVLSFVVLTACAPAPDVVASQTANANTAIAANWTRTPTVTPLPTATRTPVPTPPEITVLDAFFYNTVDSAATSKVVLQQGEKYSVILSGTFSNWGPTQWTTSGMCWGISEPRPMFPSLNKGNGQVGADPYHFFGHPNQGGGCVNGQLVNEFAEKSEIMLSVDGQNYAILDPIIKEFREDHTYSYTVTGQGHPLSVKLDDTPLDDNYGQIFVIIAQIN